MGEPTRVAMSEEVAQHLAQETLAKVRSLQGTNEALRRRLKLLRGAMVANFFLFLPALIWSVVEPPVALPSAVLYIFPTVAFLCLVLLLQLLHDRVKLGRAVAEVESEGAKLREWLEERRRSGY